MFFELFNQAKTSVVVLVGQEAMCFAGNYNHSRHARLYEYVCNDFSFETLSEIKPDRNRLETKLDELRHNITYPRGEVQVARNALDSEQFFHVGLHFSISFLYAYSHKSS